jgi:hypothetical protein
MAIGSVGKFAGGCRHMAGIPHVPLREGGMDGWVGGVREGGKEGGREG